MITFKKVREANGWMSNMSPHPIEINFAGTHLYHTAEHLFQCLRFGNQTDIRNEIMAVKSPMGAKMVAKKHADKMTTVPRSAADIDLMRATIILKLAAHPNLSQALLATGDRCGRNTGSATVVRAASTVWRLRSS